MKSAKKIVWCVIALLPLLVCLSYFAVHIGNDVAGEIIEMGKLTIYPGDGLWYIETTPGTWADILIKPLTGNHVDKGLIHSLCSLCKFLETNAGIPVSVPSFFAVLYLVYIVFLELINIVLDFILFVPRKCAELFR